MHIVSDHLFDAILQDNLGAVDRLLLADVDINARDHQGQTPLIRAAVLERTALVRLLLERGADVEARDDQGYTALMRTAFTWPHEIRCLLLDHGANKHATPVAKDSEQVRAWLEAYSRGCGNKAFRLKTGEIYEGGFFVEEDQDVINFSWAPGPFDEEYLFDEWHVIAFEDIDVTSLYW